MSPAPVPNQKEQGGEAPRRFAWLWTAENLLVALALAVLMVLPLIEIVGRKFFHRGLDGASALQQHMVLVIGLLGGMFAARDRRLLCLSTVTNFLKGKWLVFSRVFSGGFAAGISGFLCVAAIQWIQETRSSGNILAYGIPVWTVQLIMPIGFAVIALRLIWHVGDTWRGRVVAALIAAAMLGVGAHPPASPEKLVYPGLGLLLAAVVMGAPIFVMLGGAALILFWGEATPISSVSVTHYSMVTNSTLPTVPLFTLAGYFLAEGGASQRLIRVFQAFLGPLRGGPAIVAVIACAFFTSFTGASGVTILALGGLLMPVLLQAGYSERASLGLLTGSGGLGLLFPPSLPLILFAVVAANNARDAGVTMQKMFLGGLGPGVLLVAMVCWLGVRLGPKKDSGARPKFILSDAWRAAWEAKWELALPLVALVALFSGIATPVEAAAVTAMYAFIVEVFVYRDLKKPAHIAKVMAECGLLVGGVLLILGVALGFTNYLIDAQIPDNAVTWMMSAIHSKYAFLLALNLCLLVVGCLMDMFSAIMVVVPIIIPLGQAYGIDPIHLGIIFLTNMELGLLTPTAGINIFLSSYRFKKPVLEVSRAVLPVQGMMVLGLLFITYLPPLTTFLPHLLDHPKPAISQTVSKPDAP